MNKFPKVSQIVQEKKSHYNTRWNIHQRRVGDNNEYRWNSEESIVLTKQIVKRLYQNRFLSTSLKKLEFSGSYMRIKTVKGLTLTCEANL